MHQLSIVIITREYDTREYETSYLSAKEDMMAISSICDISIIVVYRVSPGQQHYVVIVGVWRICTKNCWRGRPESGGFLWWDVGCGATR
jgi:hypothetical protein